MDELFHNDIIKFVVHDKFRDTEFEYAFKRTVAQLAATEDGKILLKRMYEYRAGVPLSIRIEEHQKRSHFNPMPGNSNVRAFLVFDPRDLTDMRGFFKRQGLFAFLGSRPGPMAIQRLVFHELYHAASHFGEPNNGLELRAIDATNLFMQKYYRTENIRDEVHVAVPSKGGHRPVDLWESFNSEGYNAVDLELRERLLEDETQLIENFKPSDIIKYFGLDDQKPSVSHKFFRHMNSTETILNAEQEHADIPHKTRLKRSNKKDHRLTASIDKNADFDTAIGSDFDLLPDGVNKGLERRKKRIEQLNRTNNEQSPAAPPTPRPRPKLNPITEGVLKDMPDDGRLVLVAELAGQQGRKNADKAEAARLARFDVQRKKAQDLEDIKAGKLSTVWDRYGHPKAVRDLLGEEDYQSFVDDRLEAGLIFHATAGLHLLQDKDLFGIAEGTTALEAPHDKLAELMTPKVMAAAAERAREILTLRKEKPSEAVLLSTELAKRKEAFDAAFEANEPVDADEMDRFLFYFEAAQKEIGIAEPAIELIPHKWASQVAERFEMPDTGNGTPTNRREHKAALKQQYTDMQNTFGRRTDDVIAYSLARSADNGALSRKQGLSQR